MKNLETPGKTGRVGRYSMSTVFSINSMWRLRKYKCVLQALFATTMNYLTKTDLLALNYYLLIINR